MAIFISKKITKFPNSIQIAKFLEINGWKLILQDGPIRLYENNDIEPHYIRMNIKPNDPFYQIWFGDIIEIFANNGTFEDGYSVYTSIMNMEEQC